MQADGQAPQALNPIEQVEIPDNVNNAAVEGLNGQIQQEDGAVVVPQDAAQAQLENLEVPAGNNALLDHEGLDQLGYYFNILFSNTNNYLIFLNHKQYKL